MFPTAVYYDVGERERLGVVRPALDTTRTGRLRADVTRLTQDLAQQLDRGFELLRIEVLAAHYQHVMFDKVTIEPVAAFRVDRLGEVDAGDLGAGVLSQGRDGEGRHRAPR